MKKLLPILAIAALTLPSYAQENPEARTAPAPNIVVPEPNFNFGEMSNSLNVEHTFEIRNEGNLSLTISKTKTSCGCTVANLSRKIIPPGESAELTARLSLKNRSGNQRKNITIQSDDPDTPTLQLTLEGTALASVSITPQRLFISGLKSDAVEVRSVDIKSLNKPIQITTVNNPLKEVEATLETLRPGHEYRLNIKTVPPLASGRFQNHIRLKTDDPAHPELSVLVMGDVVGALAFAPAQLVMNLQSTNALTRYIVVRPGSESSFNINGIQLPNETMTAKTIPMGNNGFRIQLQNVVPHPDLHDKKIIIHTDSEGMPRIEVPFIIRGETSSP